MHIVKQGRILITAQNTLLRESLKHLLSAETLSVVREESTLQDALIFLRSASQPVDLIVCDQSESRDGDIECLTVISDEFPQVAIAVLVAGETSRGLETVIKGGARAFLPNSISPKALTLVIQLLLVSDGLIAMPRIVSGAFASTPTGTPRVATAFPDKIGDRPIRLSPREVAILEFLKEGAPNKLIARKLDVAEATVKVHLKSLLRKISVGNRTQAAIWAMGHSNTADASSTPACQRQ